MARSALLAALLVCALWLCTVHGFHILIVLWPWSSRLQVITQLICTLRKQPYEITILTAITYMETIQTSLSKHVAQPQREVRFITYEHTDMEAAMHSVSDASSPVTVLYTLKSVRSNLEMKTIHNTSLISELFAYKFDVLLGDVIDPVRVILAAILKCQRIDLDTGAGGASSAAGQYNLRLRTSYVPAYTSLLPMGPYTLLQKTQNILANTAMAMIGDWVLDRGYDALVRDTAYSSFKDASKRGVLISIVSCDFTISPTRTIAPFEKFVGPFLPKPAAPLALSLQQRLDGADTQVSLIVVSPGSTFSFTHECSAAILRALVIITSTELSSIRTRVVWKLSPSSREHIQSILGDSLLLSALESNGTFTFMPWIPQNDLLGQPQAKLFISHCGMQGLNEAAYHGVPLLCLPITADQFDNAYNVRYRRIGDFIPKNVWLKAETSTLLEAIRKVFTDAEYLKNAQVVSGQLRSHPLTPLEQASEWVDYGLHLVRAHRSYGDNTPGSDAASFLKPPEMFMTWIDLHSLDLFALLVFVAYLALLCCRMALRVTPKSKRE